MNKEELIGKLQMVYVGDKNALNELIGYYDGLKQGIEELQQENQELKLELSGYRQAILKDKEMLGLKEENDKLKKQLKKKKKPQIFIDTQDMEERYAEGLYQDFLKEENKQIKKQLEEINKKI